MMRELGFVVNPVLVIDAKASEHILHRHGSGQMKHIDVAHLWRCHGVLGWQIRVSRSGQSSLAENVIEINW